MSSGSLGIATGCGACERGARGGRGRAQEQRAANDSDRKRVRALALQARGELQSRPLTLHRLDEWLQRIGAGLPPRR